jgi:SagB-type dehydrogenase family enzyme
MTGSQQLRLSLGGPRVEELWPNCEPGLRAVLERLCSRGATEPELVALVRSVEPALPLPSLFFHLRMLERWGLLRRTLMLDETELATLVPMTPAHEFALPELAEDQPVVLSRFALLRRDPALAEQHRSAMMLESPTCHARIVVHDRRVVAVLHELAAAEPPCLAQLRSACADLPAATLALLVRLLLGNGFVRTLVDGRTSDEDPAMLTWSFADLLFHSRSRIGRHDRVVGKSYAFRGMVEPLPAVRPVPEGPHIELPPADIGRLVRDDRSFTAVLESRTSIRQHGDPPISLAQLGELLHRSARVRKLEPSSPYSLYEFSNRPLPGGGGCYELEIYLAIDRCVGLDRGVYHYDPLEHRLTRVAEPSAELDELLHRTGAATATGLVAQVLVCIAARFQRMAWPYENMAYATTLKNVGVLMQTLYLVATAMELAPCAMGYGDSDLFARVAKTDYFQETTVGEFLLGSRPT